MSDLTRKAEWQALLTHKNSLADFNLANSFSDDPDRIHNFSLKAAGIYLDYSKNIITKETIQKLLALAEEQHLSDGIKKMANGEDINFTEYRPALHWLLRAQQDDHLPDALKPLLTEVTEVRARMKKVAAQIMNGQLRGYTGKPFTDIVHIGIGGSDLGPAMIYQALQPYHQAGIQCHFVANICANDILETLAGLSPHTTLFIVASKSFTTLETITNSNTARAWLKENLIDDEAIANHFMAVTSKPDRAQTYGIREAFIFPFWDWVGGRYSLWSAISLSLCIGLGYDTFEQLLEGAHAMDQHFFNAPHEQNMPVIMALLGIWYINFWHRQSHLIAPYDHRLRRLPAFLQQLEMESNGKSANTDNKPIDYDSCPVIWGEEGANSQHSFFQRLHQGPEFVPVDFIIALKNHHPLQQHQDWLFANCLAQSRTLMLGQPAEAGSPISEHKKIPGNRPSSMLIMENLSPASLGSLLALYEHKVYVQSLIWEINAFDQWGVELGKQIGAQIKSAIDHPEQAASFDASTRELISLYLKSNQANQGNDEL